MVFAVDHTITADLDGLFGFHYINPPSPFILNAALSSSYPLHTTSTLMERPAALYLRPIELAKTSKVEDEVPHAIGTSSVLENSSSNSATPTLVVDDVPDGGFDGWLIVFACSTIT